MADSFTMFGKFGDVCAMLEEQDRKDLTYAICMYGMFGEVVELKYPLNAVFASLMDDIDNSKKQRKQGAEGAKARERNRQSESKQKGGSDECATPLDGISEPPLDDTDKTPCEKSATQTKPNQTNTNQTKRKSVARFAPPAPHDVAAFAAEYAAQKGLDPGGFDAERFVGYYGSNGWKVGRNPMRDWRAAVRGWVSRDCKPAGGGLPDEYASL